MTLTPTASIIPTVTVSSSSLVTSAENVIYTLSMEIPGFLLSTTYFVVQLPDELSVIATRTLSTNCGRFGLSGFKNNTRLSCDYEERNLTVTKGFASGSTTDPVSLVFSMSSLRNPRSLQPTYSFIIAFYDASDDYPTYIKTNSSSITMATATTIKST